jgi:hypothetical protein
MDAKVEEFRNFTQGTLKVQEYTIRFICMMRYAPEETSSDKKEMYHYKKGLNSRLKIALLGHECRTLRQMINKVLEMERDRLEADAQRERRRGVGVRVPHAPWPRGSVGLLCHSPALALPRELLRAVVVVSTPPIATAPLRAALLRARARVHGRHLRPPPQAVCPSRASPVASRVTSLRSIRRGPHPCRPLRGRHQPRERLTSQPAAISLTYCEGCSRRPLRGVRYVFGTGSFSFGYF